MSDSSNFAQTSAPQTSAAHDSGSPLTPYTPPTLARTGQWKAVTLTISACVSGCTTDNNGLFGPLKYFGSE